MSNSEIKHISPLRRSIGAWGTLARLVVGAGLLSAAFGVGTGWNDAAIGLVGIPGAVMLVLGMRGRSATPLRLYGLSGHVINCAFAVAVFVLMTPAALLFYGVSTLLAAVRGYAGCEVFAVSNWLLRRDDQIACAIFSPIDAVEARVGDS